MRSAFVALALLGAACSSAPTAPKAPPAPVTLADADFDKLVEAQRNTGNYFQEVKAFTVMLERKDLTTQQRIRALQQRAARTANTAENKMSALADYEEIMRLAPPGDPAIKRAQDNKDYVLVQKGYIDRRLADGPDQKDKSQYLNDLLALGRWDDAALYAKSRVRELSISNIQVEKFFQLGYLCDTGKLVGPQYRYGADNTGYKNVSWCDPKGLPASDLH